MRDRDGREEDGGRDVRSSFQTGLPPVQDRWGARGGRERETGRRMGTGLAFSADSGMMKISDTTGTGVVVYL
jgi:hypothetical protein